MGLVPGTSPSNLIGYTGTAKVDCFSPFLYHLHVLCHIHLGRRGRHSEAVSGFAEDHVDLPAGSHIGDCRHYHRQWEAVAASGAYSL